MRRVYANQYQQRTNTVYPLSEMLMTLAGLRRGWGLHPSGIDIIKTWTVICWMAAIVIKSIVVCVMVEQGSRVAYPMAKAA